MKQKKKRELESKQKRIETFNTKGWWQSLNGDRGLRCQEYKVQSCIFNLLLTKNQTLFPLIINNLQTSKKGLPSLEFLGYQIHCVTHQI